MKAIHICFLLILLCLVEGTTDITLLNCPSQYNMTHFNLTTNSSQSLI